MKLVIDGDDNFDGDDECDNIDNDADCRRSHW